MHPVLCRPAGPRRVRRAGRTHGPVGFHHRGRLTRGGQPPPIRGGHSPACEVGDPWRSCPGRAVLAPSEGRRGEPEPVPVGRHSVRTSVPDPGRVKGEPRRLSPCPCRMSRCPWTPAVSLRVRRCRLRRRPNRRDDSCMPVQTSGGAGGRWRHSFSPAASRARTPAFPTARCSSPCPRPCGRGCRGRDRAPPAVRRRRHPCRAAPRPPLPPGAR